MLADLDIDIIEAGETKSVSLEMVNHAPDIIKTILDGSVSDGFTLRRFRKCILDDWDAPRIDRCQ